jgi:hypothetical protein
MEKQLLVSVILGVASGMVRMYNMLISHTNLFLSTHLPLGLEVHSSLKIHFFTLFGSLGEWMSFVLNDHSTVTKFGKLLD